MQGHPKLGYMPDYEPASVSSPAEPPSVGDTFPQRLRELGYTPEMLDADNPYCRFGDCE